MSGGACDCHVHVIGDAARYPMVADRQYTPGPASVDELRAHMAALGLQRAVIVQPSVYGSDNRCLLDALAAFAGRARGVAVVAEDSTREQLQLLHEAGVRGLRINHESGGRSDAAGLLTALRFWAARLRGLPWHLQVYARLDTLAEAAPELAGLGLPVVLDHFAMAPLGTALDDPRLQRVLELLRGGTAYIKLSAAYRIGNDEAAALDLARSFIAANPDRVLWGSDWPHTNREPGKAAWETSAYRVIPRERLARQMREWAPDDATRQRLLVANAARLYGFG